jgi:hypothetical protein
MMINACLLVAGSAAVVFLNSSLAEQLEANAPGGGGGVQLEPVPAGNQPWKTRAVFVCRGQVPVIFSDRPCGPGVEERAMSVPEPQAGRAASTVPRAAPAATLPRRQPEPQQSQPDDDQSHCRRLRDQREKLDDQMRAGYPAREAAQLWNRWRNLNTEIHRSRC